VFDQLVPAPLADAAEAHLKQTGVARGQIVAWLGHNSWDMIATLVACQRIGAVLLPLNWRLAAAELGAIVRHAQAAHLLGTPELESLALDVLRQGPLHAGPAEGIQKGDLLLVYTSGTTGQPKGALHTAAGMQANAVAAIAAQHLTARDRVLSVLPLFHVGGLCIQTLPALVVGAKLSLLPRFEPVAWFDAVEQWKPTTTLLVPAVMKALVDHPRWATADLSSLAYVNSGSQIVPRALIDAFQTRGLPVAQVYGSTETGPVSVVLKPEEALTHPGMAGRPALNVQLKLAEDGEILLKAPNLMRGYHRSSEPALDEQGWFHTGDLALEHADGLLEVVGRSKELIISGGENIHPAEIEQLAQDWPGVAECAVVGLADERWGEVPVLAVVPQPGVELDAPALLAQLATRLARFKLPRQVRVVEALPKTALGKVQRKALAQQLSGPPPRV
jgi:fatty-acyl-CoA synthase